MTQTPGQLRRGGNQYIDHFPSFDKTPKAVIAAMAVSFAIQMTGNENIIVANRILRYEWKALYDAGIVPQRPPNYNNIIQP